MSLYSNYIRESNEDIAHYGVLGMKWGVRKAEQYMNMAEGVRYQALKKRLKAEGVDKETRKAALKKAKIRSKLNIASNRAHTNAMIEAGKNKVARGEAKGLKSKDLANDALRRVDDMLPGFAKYMHDTKRQAAVNQIVLGVAGLPLSFAYEAVSRGELAKKYSTSEDITNYVTELLKEN